MLNRIKEARSNPKLVYYYIQGHINWWIHGRYITKFLIKKQECPDCFENNACKICGCPFNKLALSDKKCSKNVEESDN